MKKTGILTILLFLFAGVFFFIKKAEEDRLIEVLEKEKLSLHHKVQTSTNQSHNTDLEFTDIQLQKLNKTWNDFTAFEHNSTTNWFKHKDFIKKSKADSLLAIIKEDGSLGLITNYFGKHPIHHYQIQVKIGDILIDSVKVRQANPHTLSGTIQANESLFFDEAFAANIIQQIYLNTETDIEVTLVGKDAFKSFTLSPDQKNAFKETWALHKLITI